METDETSVGLMRLTLGERPVRSVGAVRGESDREVRTEAACGGEGKGAVGGGLTGGWKVLVRADFGDAGGLVVLLSTLRACG